MTMFEAFAAVRAATLGARTRTGDKTLCTEAQAGRVRVCVLVKEGRRVASVPAGQWCGMADAIKQLDSMQTPADLADAMAYAAILRAA